MWILAGFGFNAAATMQTETAIWGLRLLMSYIPAIVAAVAIAFLVIYPLTTTKMKEIAAQLKEERQHPAE